MTHRSGPGAFVLLLAATSCRLAENCSASAATSSASLNRCAAFVPEHLRSGEADRSMGLPFHRVLDNDSSSFGGRTMPSLASTEGGDDVGSSQNKKKKRKKKKKALVINPNLVGASVSSDGLLEDRVKEREARRGDATPVKSNLGVPSRRRMKDVMSEQNAGEKKKNMSAKAARIQRQRTSGGTVDSSIETVLSAPPGEQNVQVQVARRGSKTITMVRGLTSSMDDRKALLKQMKSKLGGGGTLVEGVLELLGSHADKVLAHLKSKGFAKARVVGK